MTSKLKGANKLEQHRPNLLAIKYLLDINFQHALYRQRALDKVIRLPNLSDVSDDALMICGIGWIIHAFSKYLAAPHNHVIHENLNGSHEESGL
jgi:hypothetical protein